jgi:hypothetical protein
MLSIQELCERYKITRKTLYDRVKGIGRDFQKGEKGNKVYADPLLTQKLDQLDTHLRKGGRLDNFIEITKVDGVFADDLDTPLAPLASVNSGMSLEEIVYLFRTLKAESPLHKYAELEKAVDKKWELPTSDIYALTGFRPRLKKGVPFVQRGSFTFIPCGKRIGRELGWRVVRQPQPQLAQLAATQAIYF